MTKRLFYLLLLLFPTLSFAQSAFSDCDIVFTSVQHLPSLKISNEAFQDTLAAELNSKGFHLKNNEITYKFVVTKESAIDDLTIESGSFKKEEILQKAIVQFADLWVPATQNGYKVCAYVRLKIQFADDKISIEIMQ